MNPRSHRFARTTPPGTILHLATTLVVLFFFSTPASAAPVSSGATAVADSVGAHSFCGADLVITERGAFLTSPSSRPWIDFTAHAGLWVGAIADRGKGAEVDVSSSHFQSEFGPAPGSARAARPFGRHTSAQLESIRIQYVDTVEYPFPTDEPHVPLGLSVVQQSWAVTDPDLGDVVRMSFLIQNISAEHAPPGWPLEKVYIGILADPDIGRTDRGQFWSDDHGAFLSAREHPGPSAPPAARWGDLAYALDESGNIDDVSVQFGIALVGRRAHSFRVWSGGVEDPRSDVDRYELMRGVSDDWPTIDPNTIRSNDQRILLSAGPIPSLAPGETTRFAIAFVCGELVPPAARAEPPAYLLAGAPGNASAGPNPVRIGAAGVLFSRLAPRASVRIYSLDGRLVREIGARTGDEAMWDLRTRAGGRVSAGTYFYRAIAPGVAPANGKLVVLR